MYVWICATVTDRQIRKHFVFRLICNRNNSNVFSKTILFIKLHFVILFSVQSQHPFCWFNSNDYITLVRWILIEWYLWRIEMIWAIQQFISFFFAKPWSRVVNGVSNIHLSAAFSMIFCLLPFTVYPSRISNRKIIPNYV